MPRESNGAALSDREQKAWRLRASGMTQMAIAQELGISQPGTCKLLARVSRRMAGEFLEEVLSVKLQQSAVLEHIAAEALSAWQRSKEDAVTEVTVKGKIAAGGDDKGKSRAQITRTVTGQSGNPALLNQARGALADIRSIWGLDAPKQQEVSGPQGQPIEFRDVGRILDDKIARLAASLDPGSAAGEPDP